MDLLNIDLFSTTIWAVELIRTARKAITADQHQQRRKESLNPAASNQKDNAAPPLLKGETATLTPSQPSTDAVNATTSNTVKARQDAISMPPPPLKHYPKPPPPTRLKYGKTIQYSHPVRVYHRATTRPPCFDNVTIPPHLIPILHRDAYDLALKTCGVRNPPPQNRNYALLSAWYNASASPHSKSSANKDADADQQTYCKDLVRYKPCPSRPHACLVDGNGKHIQKTIYLTTDKVCEVAISPDIAQHIVKDGCTHCRIVTIHLGKAKILEGEKQKAKRDIEKTKKEKGGIMVQLKKRLERKSEKEGWGRDRSVRMGDSSMPRAGSEGLAKEYAEAFERWDGGMKTTLPGYAGDKGRREWFLSRDQAKEKDRRKETKRKLLQLFHN